MFMLNVYVNCIQTGNWNKTGKFKLKLNYMAVTYLKLFHLSNPVKSSHTLYACVTAWHCLGQGHLGVTGSKSKAGQCWCHRQVIDQKKYTNKIWRMYLVSRVMGKVKVQRPTCWKQSDPEQYTHHTVWGIKTVGNIMHICLHLLVTQKIFKEVDT